MLNMPTNLSFIMKYHLLTQPFSVGCPCDTVTKRLCLKKYRITSESKTEGFLQLLFLPPQSITACAEAQDWILQDERSNGERLWGERLCCVVLLPGELKPHAYKACREWVHSPTDTATDYRSCMSSADRMWSRNQLSKLSVVHVTNLQNHELINSSCLDHRVLGWFVI